MPVEAFDKIADLVITNPVSNDTIKQGDDHLRGIKATLKTTFPNASRAFYFPSVSAKSAGFTADQDQTLYEVDASGGVITASLPAIASVAAGYEVAVKKTDSSANAVTLDASTSETIDGALTLALAGQFDSVAVRSDGTEWHVVSRYIVTLDFTDLGVTPTTLSGYGITDAEALGLVNAINTKTDNYTLALGDVGEIVEMNASTVKTVTIPTNASVAFATKTWIIVSNIGTADVDVAGAVGVTLNGVSAGTISIAAGFSVVIYKRGTNDWRAPGHEAV